MRQLTGLCTAALMAGLLPFVQLSPAEAKAHKVPADKQLQIRGHGYGHGIGMSQHGAEGAARQGRNHKQILRHYYPGTTLSTARGRITVLISADTTSEVIVQKTAGLRVRDLGDGKWFTLPAKKRVSQWRIGPAAGDRSTSVVQYRKPSGWRRWKVPGRTVLKGDGEFRAPGTLALILPDGSVKRYRGALRASSPYAGSSLRDTVNVIRLQPYLRGVVPMEMPALWHPNAVRAQAVAARTYARFLQREPVARHYQVCDTTACQVYGGVNAEHPAATDAVARTSGQILTYEGEPAFTQFSSSSGGWTAQGSRPYLQARKDPYDDWSGNSVHFWRTTIDAGRFERSYPSIGKLRKVKVASRNGNGAFGGRVERLVLIGSSGRRNLSGNDVRWLFGLRSDWFAFNR